MTNTDIIQLIAIALLSGLSLRNYFLLNEVKQVVEYITRRTKQK